MPRSRLPAELWRDRPEAKLQQFRNVTIAHPHLLAARERLTAAITPVAAAPHRHPNSTAGICSSIHLVFRRLQMYETPFRHHSNLAPPAASAHCVNMLDHQRGKSVASGIMISTLLICVAQQSIVAQPLGTFSVTGAMTTLRFQHSATLLMDGRVLLAGGYGSAGEGLASAEIYDPATGAFSPTGGMTSPRRMHSATLLPDGRVLIVDGYSSADALGSAELSDHREQHVYPDRKPDMAEGWAYGNSACFRQGLDSRRLWR